MRTQVVLQVRRDRYAAPLWVQRVYRAQFQWCLTAISPKCRLQGCSTALHPSVYWYFSVLSNKSYCSFCRTVADVTRKERKLYRKLRRVRGMHPSVQRIVNSSRRLLRPRPMYTAWAARLLLRRRTSAVRWDRLLQRRPPPEQPIPSDCWYATLPINAIILYSFDKSQRYVNHEKTDRHSETNTPYNYSSFGLLG